MNRSPRTVAAVKFAAALAAPFVLAVVTYELAKLSPGTVSVAHWKILVSLSFIAAGAASLHLVWRTRFSTGYKAVLGVLVGAFFLLLAFTFSLRSKCGDESAFIGKSQTSIGLESCG